MYNKIMTFIKTTSENIKTSTLTTPEIDKSMNSGRVDINHLLDRARKEKNDDRRSSLIYSSLFIFIIILGVSILSY